MPRKANTTAEPNEVDFGMPDLSPEAPEVTIDAPTIDLSGKTPPDYGNFRDGGTASFSEPEPEPKRRRSRGKKQPEPRQPLSPEARAKAAKALTLGFLAAFNLASKARGAHWRLEQEEASELGNAWAEALEPWLPAIAGVAPWAAAIVVTYSVVEPRLTRDGEIAELQKVSETPEVEAVIIARGNNAANG